MTADAIDLLFAPFRDDQISWRLGSTTKDKSRGMALAYIDARDVMDRLDDACGAGGWQCEYVPMSNGTTCCRIGIQSPTGDWVWKSNGGSATGDVDKESEREMAEKGAYSDSFKRAAVLWGIGRYLYSLDSPWVELEPKGNSHVMKAGERSKLDKAHANFVRSNFKNAKPSDAGSRETPKAPLAAGADKSPTNSAPAQSQKTQTMSKGDARADNGAIDHELRACTSLDELVEWMRINEKRIDLQPTDWQKEIRSRYDELVHDFAKLELDMFLKDIFLENDIAEVREIGKALVSATVHWPADLVAIVRDAYAKRLKALKPTKEPA